MIGKDEPKVSRLDQMKKDGLKPQMPPNPAPAMINRLLEIGLSEAQGMGASPLSWQSIEAWQRLVGVSLPPWEVRLLRRLSTEYLAEGRRAECENCPPPFRAEITADERAVENKRLESLLG